MVCSSISIVASEQVRNSFRSVDSIRSAIQLFEQRRRHHGGATDGLYLEMLTVLVKTGGLATAQSHTKRTEGKRKVYGNCIVLSECGTNVSRIPWKVI